MAGETGNDVEHLVSTSVSVVFVLVGECEVTMFVDMSDGEAERDDDDKVPLRRAGRMLLSVLVTVRCDDAGAEKLAFRSNEEILNDDDDETDGGVVVDEDDCSICVRKALSVDELTLSFPIIRQTREQLSMSRSICISIKRKVSCLTIGMMIQLQLFASLANALAEGDAIECIERL